MRKTVVLTTSDIQTPTYNGNELVRMTSRGLLEAALAAGHRVLVFSTRTKVSDTDAWWVALVRQENIFLTDEVSRKDYYSQSGDSSSGWKKGFAALGLAWPTDDRGEPIFWTSAWSFLQNAGILTPHDLKHD